MLDGWWLGGDGVAGGGGGGRDRRATNPPPLSLLLLFACAAGWLGFRRVAGLYFFRVASAAQALRLICFWRHHGSASLHDI